MRFFGRTPGRGVRALGPLLRLAGLDVSAGRSVLASDSAPSSVSPASVGAAALVAGAVFGLRLGLAPGAGALAARRRTASCFLASSSFSIMPKT
ncbi:Uncharacterised protein [Mycobacterium tuberculosis]|uniref:Uncharacterized protein n=1 Tax=Mycobacterium tuberculosis TaxID=1773 RepID=A0A655HRU2_MYCTX|nr:Uncharacterised protein [Mycobacterium tuberculosis]